MRKLLFAINITLDGCVDHTKQLPTDETLHFFAQLLRDADLQVFGRKTYELMVPYWPEVANNPSSSPANADFAQAFVSINKVVFSRTLTSTDAPNTRILQADLHDEILKLKKESGRNILVGGVSLASQLIELGLVDEFLFVVSPVIAGEGDRLLPGVVLAKQLHLNLRNSKIFQSGAVALHYSTR